MEGWRGNLHMKMKLTSNYGQKSCRVKCLDAIYAHTLWKAISPEPLGLQYIFLHFWNLCVKTDNLSTFGGLYDPPLKSSYNLKNEEKKIKIVKNRFFFSARTVLVLMVVQTSKSTQINRLGTQIPKMENPFL